MTQAIPILMYHSLAIKKKGTVLRSIHVPPKRFCNHMKMLKLLGYKALSMKQLAPYLRGEKQGKVVGLTFDDGYLNNLTHAAPLLQRLGFSSTLYVVSDLIGQHNIWDKHKNIDSNPLMNEQEIKQWLNYGQDIGAHTKNHVHLDKISEPDAYEEIVGCKLALENMFQTEVSDFCYPYGHFNHKNIEQVKAASYKTATTTIRGRANYDGTCSDLFTLPRVFIPYHTWPLRFYQKSFSAYEDRRVHKS
ncbi:polysaccharide deacetylase family protein [Pseudoalteromonas sp. S16_S37]|uniref:polysaccharide deacetylase family protein n=1 Tax=Pseudoalteromonas sp. S16_S37 TaxID=2720228 RepID=UPI0016808F22|nr:polysaccharide deacetylase family protein [Pseudoalteromonas sp. S16_S37]MBD1581437.1 polysaccharide deacetylase family protein [Pseudoalteromonas sp. S16_S37]